ncbi:MAG: heme-binding protein [Chloroflexota bacterium]
MGVEAPRGKVRGGGAFPLDNVDGWRGPTASQAAGLTLAAARAIVTAVQAQARKLGVAMSVAVVDAGDQLVAFERMDAADLVGITLARDKAFTALVNRMPTRDLAPIVQPGAEFYGYESIAGGRTIVFAGGMPLERDGVLVGAVGVSGGDAAQDQRAVEAGVSAFGAD